MINANFNKFYKIAYSFKDDSSDADIRILNQDLHLTKNDSILDVWCGYGRISKKLINDCLSVTWIDYCENYIIEARNESGNKANYILWDFTKLREFFQEETFDKVYSLYSCLWHGTRGEDEQTFEGVSSILKKKWLFLFEYENITYHTQWHNSQKSDFYEIDWKYRRILNIKMDPLESRLFIGNELWDLQSEKRLHSWDFWLNLYTQWEIRNMANIHGLELVSIHGRYSNTEIYWYEPQIIFVFQKR